MEADQEPDQELEIIDGKITINGGFHTIDTNEEMKNTFQLPEHVIRIPYQCGN